VGESGFSVVLRFGGQPKKLAIPYAALTRFHDPSVPFALQFDPGETEGPAHATAELETLTPKPHAARTKTETETDEDDPPGGDDGPKIVSLDQFRKK
jgi:hypothetical protein